jgi:hypothetical protein
MRRAVAMEARSPVQVSVAQARQWFLDLETYPERYAFETHTGFAFTQGGFGQVGSRFVTRERFLGLKLALTFELGEIEERRFTFELRHPPLPIWGAFAIDRAREGTTSLALQLGGTTRWGELFLKCPLVRWAVGRQIGYEVANVKASMEALHAGRRE